MKISVNFVEPKVSVRVRKVEENDTLHISVSFDSDGRYEHACRYCGGSNKSVSLSVEKNSETSDWVGTIDIEMESEEEKRLIAFPRFCHNYRNKETEQFAFVLDSTKSKTLAFWKTP